MSSIEEGIKIHTPLFQQLLKEIIFLSQNEGNEEKLRESLYDTFSPFIKSYNDYFNYKNDVENVLLDKIKIWSIFASFFTNEFESNCKENQVGSNSQRYAIVTMLLMRAIEATDENICLFDKSFGFSTISNFRIMIEGLGLTNYIWNHSENESQRFRDYAFVRQAKFQKKPLDGRLSKYNGCKSFSKNCGWVSEEKFSSLVALVRKSLPEKQKKYYSEWYNFCCEFAHSSPFSLEAVLKINEDAKQGNEHFSFFKIEELIKLNCIILHDYIEYFSESIITDKIFKEEITLLLKVVVSVTI